MKPLLEPYPQANVLWVDEIDSTNGLADRMAERWDEEASSMDFVIVARRQSAGRGRDGRRWESPVGGIYATWTGIVSTPDVMWLPLAAGIIVAEAIETLGGTISVGLKWPNDLVVDGKKIGGILAKARIRGTKSWVAVGFGINVASVPPVVNGAGLPATSLHQRGCEVDTSSACRVVVAAFVERIRRLLATPEACRQQWVLRSVHHKGDVLAVRTRDVTLTGTFEGFGKHGELLLRLDDGVRSFNAVDVVESEG